MDNVDTEERLPSAEVGEAPRSRGAVLKEVIGVYLVTLLAIKGVVMAERAFPLPSDVLILVPLLFVYVPIGWLRYRGEEPADHGMVLEELWPSIKLNIKLYLVIFPGFILLNHLYQGIVFHRSPSLPGETDFWTQFLFNTVPYHLLFVALSEELFYRGYMQSRLNRVYDRPWRTFGTHWGPALLVTAVLFTVGHSIVEPRWWHFAIFLPALIFGWIRERTGHVTAGILFHALCNITMTFLDKLYGVGG